ncbi:MAG: tetratricopeptide repeat protein [Acidobacteriota bacterium]
MRAIRPMTARNLTAVALATLLLGPAAEAATNLELQLEEAIYQEETAGDVEKAISLYRKILDDSDGERSLLARTHERLAVCYRKLGREDDVRKTLRQLIDTYPEQTEVVQRARRALEHQLALEPAPWLDGEVLTYVIRLPTGVPFGVYSFAVESRTEDGVDAWQIRVRRFHDGAMRDQGRSRAVVERDSMRPLHGAFIHNLYGSAKARYDEGSYRLALGPEEQVIEHEGVVFDNEEWVYLTRRLPLAVGYQTSLPLNTYSQPSPLDVSFEITGQKTVKVPAGTFDCFKAKTSIGQTFFYSTGPERYVVKMKLPGADAELVSVSQRREGESAVHHDDALGFQITAPPGWIFHPNEAMTDGKKALVHLLDPTAEHRSFFMFDKRAPKKGTPLEKLARKTLAGDATVLEQHTIREDSWREDEINGRPALFVTTDFRDGDLELSRYLVWVSGETTSARFVFNMPRERLNDLQPGIDEVVASLQLD